MLKYQQLVRRDTFIGEYMDLCDSTETPVAYDFWCAMWLMGNALGRSVVVSRPGAPVHLNWYVILCAESGITRKSTAVGRATRLWRNLRQDHENLIESKTSPEMVLTTLHNGAVQHGQSFLSISISELAAVLGREKYAINMPSLLTDLYDCPEERVGGGTLSRGTVRLTSVFTSFLSATTPSWLFRGANPDIVEGGFTSRCIFVWAEERKRAIPWPEEPSDLKERERRLRGYLTDLRSPKTNRIDVLPNARRHFSNWYRRRATYTDPFRSSWQSREDSHVLRIAACLSINDGRWQISVDDIKKAIRIVDEVREQGATIFTGGGTDDKLLRAVDKIRDVISRAGTTGAKQSSITVATRHFANATQVKQILVAMHEARQVDLLERQTGGRPVRLWRMTPLLNDPQAANEMLRRLNEQAIT